MDKNNDFFTKLYSNVKDRESALQEYNRIILNKVDNLNDNDKNLNENDNNEVSNT